MGAHDNPNSQANRTTPLTCKQTTSLMAAYLAGELKQAAALALDRHLRACPDCVAFLNTYKKTILLVQSFLNRHPAVPKPARSGCALETKQRV